MNSNDLKQQKKELRKRLSEALKSLTPDEIARQSSIITSRALALPEYKNASSLSIFLSMPGKEVSTQEIVRQAFLDGKKVFIPYIHASKKDTKSKVMDMLRLQDENDLESLQPDPWGIPSLSRKSISERENALGCTGCLEDMGDNFHVYPGLDLIFMPSVAFDSSLNRLGHGKGFYDRYLTLYQSARSPMSQTNNLPHLVGLALKEQVLLPGETIPTDERDWKVDSVVSSGDIEPSP